MFSDIELDFIKQAAKNTKNQGELAVAKWIIDLNGHWYGPWNWTETKLSIIQYCAEECKRQHSGEMSVYDMVNAYDYVHSLWNGQAYPNLDLRKIEHIGSLVEPIDNRMGFRKISIGVTDGFGGWIEKAEWQEIPRLLTHLIESYYEGFLGDPIGSPKWDHPVATLITGLHPLAKSAEDQFYYEYENIHPFRDDNGRSGKILYNYLNGTLENPIMPPNFWGSSNP